MVGAITAYQAQKTRHAFSLQNISSICKQYSKSIYLNIPFPIFCASKGNPSNAYASKQTSR